MSDQVAMESEEIYMKEAALNFLRRNISLAGRDLNSPEVKGARQLFGYTLKHGMQWLNSDDQSFMSAVEIFSKGKIEKSLTAFCASESAKLLGVVVSTVCPQLAQPIALKQIMSDLAAVKKSVEVIRNKHLPLALEFLEKAFRQLESDYIGEAKKYFEKALDESTNGLPLATSFENTLRLFQIKMTSSVILECYTTIDGVQFFGPVECLSTRRRLAVQYILEDGFHRILFEGEKVTNQKLGHSLAELIYGKKRLCQEVQQQIDPYLSTFYDIYSMTSSLTKPFVDPMSSVPKLLEFQVKTSYIAEGEEDNVKVQILHHPKKQVTLFMWKEFEKSRASLCIRYKRFLWRCKIIDGHTYSLKMVHDAESLELSCDKTYLVRSTVEPEKLPNIDQLVSDLNQKIENNLCGLNMKQLHWVSSVTSDYLRTNGFDIDDSSKRIDDLGNTLLHLLVQVRDVKPLKLLVSKFSNVNTRNDRGETPLHITCKLGNQPAAAILLSFFADVNAKDNDGNTPLMNVARRKNPSISFLDFLLEKQADLCLENKFRQKAWDIATSIKSNGKVLKLLNPYYR